MTGEKHFLRLRRQELGLSQTDLALRMKHRGVKLTRHKIGLWERGEREPELSAGDLHSLADALRWDTSDLKRAMGDA